MGAGSSASLKKARSSDKAAEELFATVDANSDGKLTAAEICEAAQKFGEAIKAQWNPTFVESTIARFDRDGDGKLDMGEYKEALKAMVDAPASMAAQTELVAEPPAEMPLQPPVETLVVYGAGDARFNGKYVADEAARAEGWNRAYRKLAAPTETRVVVVRNR